MQCILIFLLVLLASRLPFSSVWDHVGPHYLAFLVTFIFSVNLLVTIKWLQILTLHELLMCEKDRFLFLHSQFIELEM